MSLEEIPLTLQSMTRTYKAPPITIDKWDSTIEQCCELFKKEGYVVSMTHPTNADYFTRLQHYHKNKGMCPLGNVSGNGKTLHMFIPKTNFTVEVLFELI